MLFSSVAHCHLGLGKLHGRRGELRRRSSSNIEAPSDLTVHGPHNVDPRPLRSGANTQFTTPMVRPILHAAKTPTDTCTLLTLETTTVIRNY